MPIHVEARGWARAKGEFLYLGTPPDITWWQAYDDWWSDQDPALMLVADGSGWSAYVHGVESKRRDASGRRPSYVLVFSGSGDDDTAAEPLMRLLAAWLPGYRKGDTGGPLSTVLDEAFPAAEVERLRAEGGDGAAAEAEAKVLAALCDERLNQPGEPFRDTAGSWYGAVTDRTAVQAFLGRARALVTRGGTGSAFWLNQVTTVAEAAEVAGQAGTDTAVLALDPLDPVRGVVPLDPVRDVVPQGKASASPSTDPGNARPNTPRTDLDLPRLPAAVKVAALGAMFLAACLMCWLREAWP